MPRKCCVPACKGNYETGPKVSVFSFPSQDDLKSKWLKAICREPDFTPSKQSVVCELHFLSHEIIRNASATDSKTGETITAPLSIPRLVKGAVPSQLPGCPKYLSAPVTINRGSPDQRKDKIENSTLKKAIEASVKSHAEYVQAVNFSSLAELQDKLQLRTTHQCDWTCIIKDNSVSFVLIREVPLPKVVCTIKVNNDMILSAYYINTEVTKLKTGDTGNPLLKLPKRVTSFNELEHVQHLLVSKFGSGDSIPEDDIMLLLDDILRKLALDGNDQHQTIQFIREQLDLLKTHKSNRKYNWETTVLCSLMYSISPHAYKFLRKSGVLTLPCPSTISRLCGKFNTNPVNECDSSDMHYIQDRYKSLSPDDLCVMLLMDEIHLNSCLDYKGGNIVGSAFNCKELATSAYVFMISSLSSTYKDVVHILPVQKITGEVLHSIVKNITVKLEKIGFQVLGVVSDNNAVNRKAMSLFTGSDNQELKIMYPHPSNKTRPLFYCCDTVHILKCIRNNWLNQRDCVLEFPAFNAIEGGEPAGNEIEGGEPAGNEIDGGEPAGNEIESDDLGFKKIEGGKAMFNTVRTLHSLEKGNLLKSGYGLTLKALYPSSIERQNVKLALKVFSTDIVAALKTFGRRRSLEGWESTANFIELICRWWGIVNVKTPLKGLRLNDRYQEPITKKSVHIYTFLEQFVQWLDDWENSETTGKLSNETHCALRNSTLCLIEISKYWLTNKNKSFLLPGKIQTDGLEDRFGKYRQLAGSNYHVSMRQVYETENKIRIQNILPVVLKAKETGELLITVDGNVGDANDCDELSDDTVTLAIIVDEDSINEIKDVTWPLLNYIAGYAAHSTIKKLRCSNCEQFLVVESAGQHDNLIMVKNRGGLRYPSQDVTLCAAYTFVVAQKILTEHEHAFLQQSNHRQVLLNVTLSNLPELFLGHNCKENHNVFMLKKCLVYSCTNILLNNYTKEINDVIKRKNVTSCKRFKPNLKKA